MGKKNLLFLLLPVLFLLALGIVMLGSTSVFQHSGRADLYVDVKKQMFWMVIGGVGCAFMAFVDYQFWMRTRWLWFGLACGLLLACFTPWFGERINGSSRWVSGKLVGLGSLRFQPSEMAKLSLLFVLGGWYTHIRGQEKDLVKGFLCPVGLIAIFVLLVGMEVDLGSAALLGTVGVSVMFLAGASVRWLSLAAGVGLTGLVTMVMLIPNRLERFMAFMDLEKYKSGLGLQQWRALLAFGSGGVEGMGLGDGRQKMAYLPFAHTDFILPMIGEELGLRVTLLVVLAFVCLAVAGMRIAAHAPDRFGTLLGSGVVLFIAAQAVINIGVTTSVLPNKGLPLPFVSYGGSNLLCCLLGVGLLINIYRQAVVPGLDEPKLKRGHCRVTPGL